MDPVRIYNGLPLGQYQSHYFPDVILKEDGTFLIKHHANTKDPKDYTIEGIFTYTIDVLDPEYDTYGKIDLYCNHISLDGKEVTQIVGTFCDDISSCSEPILYLDDMLLGWWVYSGYITWGGKMRIHLNYPPQSRSGNYCSGSRSSMGVDPK